MNGVDYAALLAAAPTPTLVISPSATIVEVNRAYATLTGRQRSDLLGRTIAEAFPPHPNCVDGDGYPELAASLKRVRTTLRTDTMPLQRFDVIDPVTGRYTERYWNAVNVPVVDDAGQIIAVLHQVEELTDLVVEQRRREDLLRTMRQRGMTDVQIDALAEAQRLRIAAEALEHEALRRQSAREHVMLRLITASTTALSTRAKLRALAGAAIPVLSDVCAVYLLDRPLPAGCPVTAPIHAWRLAAPTSPGVTGPTPNTASIWSDGDPASRAIATGSTILITYDTEAPPAWADAAGVAGAIRDGRIHSSALVPIVLDGLAHAFVAFGAGPDRPAYTDEQRELFELVAHHTATAMQQGERYDTIRDTSLTLQRAMLTQPPPLDHVEIEVRYRPAGEGAEVGGDWHDVFHLSARAPDHVEQAATVDGGLAVVVGDVAGHDLVAATIMGQIRSMLRGLAIHNGGAPDNTLTALNGVIRQTRLTQLTTCILMHIAHADDGLQLTWSNAGHPAPILVDPSGTTTVLDEPRDPALGVTTTTYRAAAEHCATRGSTVLLFSDGLFEHRTQDYDDAFADLRISISSLADRDLKAMCDELVAKAPHDDDVVLIAVRRP